MLVALGVCALSLATNSVSRSHQSVFKEGELRERNVSEPNKIAL